MPQLIINPHTRTLSELLGNNTIYKVPPFQRNYSWDEDQWEDLWADLCIATEKGAEHYMGYIVLQKDEEATRESLIIDGQQRLATLSLLIMAAVRCIGDQDKKDALRAHYLTPKHLVSHKLPTSRLKLNRTNDGFYDRLLRNNARDNTPTIQTEHKSNRQILNALLYFERQITERFCGKCDKNADDDIIHFIDIQIVNRAIFTVLDVDSEDVAYVVFETLNARGVELSGADLLKNHFFSVAARQTSPMQLERMENTWDDISGALRGDITNFVRYYWMSLNGKLVRKKDIYREVRNSLNTPESVFPFLDKMKEDADIYMAMQSPTSAEWTPDTKRHLESLNLYRAKQQFPLLLSALRKWGDGKEFANLARSCAVIFFRRSVCGRNPNDLERAFADSVDLLLNDDASGARLLQHLKQHYPNDEEFEANFVRYAPKNPQLARHILLALNTDNNKFSGNYDTCTLEHILPQNPDDEWQEFDAYDIPRFVRRIGNLALLDTKSNKEMANKSFADKRQILAESNFDITRECADYEEWTPSAIDTRQRKLAEKACSVWKIQFPK